MLERIAALQQQVAELKAENAEQLENLRIKFLSKKGEISLLYDEFRAVPKEEKAAIGAPLNVLRQSMEARINELREQLSTIHNSRNGAQSTKQDLTRTPDPIELGTRHPLSLVREEIIDIFSRIGFTVASGPEVEDDKHVFGMLNFAPEHPARDMQDTFFIEKEEGVQKPTDILLRTHTSSVQTHLMTAFAKKINAQQSNQADPLNSKLSTLNSEELALRVLCPGRVYRNEAISARAHCFFHQVEGLYIAKNVSFADLRQALLYFAKEMFGPETQIRLRPSYFPFTEPSAEMDISCDLCGGKGCSFCKGTGWVEILGCGMVDPNVLESCGIDSKVYSGYAFGMGVERIANLKYRVKDLRLFSENDVRFLRQFESC
ncbi:MAG: phenylalanine--tRNA ligase subunit alpha [Paludibacteraceae bacterium]|nr:phenylalanine--tRNA ligase subunit alpha [Paludibacteraceae bacterium]